MKVLIWAGCIFVYAILITIINSEGVVLGAIPTMILFGGMVWVANALSKKYDENHTSADKKKGK